MMGQFFDNIFEGNFDKREVKQKLEEMYQRGETKEEILAAVKSMRKHVRSIKIDSKRDLLDIVGTGGDGKNSINISTIAAFVAAGAGCMVAKHCNRGVSSKFGSVDLLEKLGINVNLEPEQIKQVIEGIGIGFMYAPKMYPPKYHQAMKDVAHIRKDIGHRTLFNLAGPLTNPTKPKTMLLGAYHVGAAEELAEVAKELEIKVLVVHGQDGFDEVSLYEPTTVFDVREFENIKKYTIYPDHTPYSTPISLEVDSADESARICKKILYNKKLSKREDAMKRVIISNTAMAMYVNDLAGSRGECTLLAQESIRNGSARKKLEQLIKATNTFPK